MAQPKKRLSATRSGNRRSHLHLESLTSTTCSNCGKVIASHIVCMDCGFYKGKLVLPKKIAKVSK